MQQYIRVADGVYELHFDGQGLQIKLFGGQSAGLGDLLSSNIGLGMELKSLSNDNTHLRFSMTGLGPFPKWILDAQTALVVNGCVFHLGRPEKLDSNGMAGTWTHVYTLADSALIQARYKIVPLLRSHPGHSLQVRWSADKAVYAKGEKRVLLTMAMRNSGNQRIGFIAGTFRSCLGSVDSI
jgi:hypothetical protein